MDFMLDPEIMRKTFFMGQDGENFTHRPSQHIKIFPFTGNNNATIVTDFLPVVGEWLRLTGNNYSIPESMEIALKKISRSLDDVDDHAKEKLMQIIQKIYWDDKKLIRPNSIVSMCYIPCDDQSELKIAQYLYSVLGDHQDLQNIVREAIRHSSSEANVLEKAVVGALEAEKCNTTDIESYFQVNRVPQTMFAHDLNFVLKSNSRAKEHLIELLEFYHFFYTSQTTLTLDQFEHGKRNEIIPLYFSLDWEKTSKARACYTSGWQQLLSAIKNQFYHAITLEMLNQNPNKKQFDYIALKEYVDQNDAEEYVAEQVRTVCEMYRHAISDCSEMNDLQKNEQYGPAFAEVHYLYENVRTQFRNTGRGRVSDGYIKHFESFCHDRFLKSRGASGLMLNITEEFLIFLTKLAINDEEQLSLNEVFHQFELRGVYLDQPSKDEVIQFYTKLNLIEKKSDSGDAQYVRRIL